MPLLYFRLKAGSPPFMPNYSRNWWLCWDDLSKNNQVKRGSGLLWRYYTPPKTQTAKFSLPEIQH